MAAPVALTVDCPVCGGLIGWNRKIIPGPVSEGTALFTLSVTLDDLSARRHRRCGITP
ncbi:hypothetical protein [Arthrobacter sp. efr-133-TYG-118]|uniref:hypothetical protein n=1 Tax=Arthrobacter sp. efr-133-TYG-118 TaxID=3040279 RepID=UPI0025510931|nr:hypothetical protein [Arthrobacter sp. efr-133-TYG-118]